MKPLLIAGVGSTISSAPLGCGEDDVELRRVHVLPEAASLDSMRPTVVVLDRGLLRRPDDACRVHEIARTAVLVGLGDAGEREPGGGFPLDLLSGYVTADAPAGAVIAVLRGAFRCAAAMVGERRALVGQAERQRELHEMTNLGVALSTERDLFTLLERILRQARHITTSDAGSLYLADRAAEGRGAPRTLRGKVSQNFTLPALPFTEFSVPVDHASLAGYAAATGEPLVISDVYLLPDDVSYKQNRSFDEKFGYRTKSMLVIPMRTHRDEIIGVLQLINRKATPDSRLSSPDVVEREVLPFDERAVELVTALASQAAVAIENSRLYEDIERLFEGFVTAAVTAIESRDPSTSGHSSRVAALTVALAEAVDRATDGPYRDVRFSREQLRELRYACLLHDFGKVGVREKVLVKEKKLHPGDLENIGHRFAVLAQAADVEFERARAELLLREGREAHDRSLSDLGEARDARRAELRRAFEIVLRANDPAMTVGGACEELARLRRTTYVDFDGTERPLLDDAELRFLMIRRGTLDEAERLEIESHVTHTYRFLDQIPWTHELRDIPRIAYAHHEKLNGRGYPRALCAGAIPLQTRMMTIADIFDALTASDRPYRRALSCESALDVLRTEAREGLLDAALLDCFIDARVFDAVPRGGT